MPTTYGTKVLKSEVKKTSSTFRLDMERLAELARIEKPDGTHLSHQEMADRMGCSRVAVTRALQRIPTWQLKEQDVNDYKAERADIFAAAQQLILKYITHEKLKAASIQQLGTLFGILYDKERIERGQATQHIANISHTQLDPETKKLLERAIDSRTRSMLENKSTSTVVSTPVETDAPSGDSEGAEVDSDNGDLDGEQN